LCLLRESGAFAAAGFALTDHLVDLPLETFLIEKRLGEQRRRIEHRHLAVDEALLGGGDGVRAGGLFLVALASVSG